LNQFLINFNSVDGKASINPLLELMRIHLREKLDLEKDIPSIKIFRFENLLLNPAKQNVPTITAAPLS